MKTILVPTDFSPVSTNAMNYAVDMALYTKASIMLLNVYQIPVSMTDVPLVMISVEELKKRAEEKISELKEAIAHITSGNLKIYTETRLGNVTDELENLCKQFNPFAVVMGTKGATGLDRVIFGSTTLTAIKHLTSPVICVPPGKEFGKGIKKIGFACDFDQVVTATPTGIIKELVKTFNAELHVLNVDYNNRRFKPETPQESLLLHTMLEDLHPVYHLIQHTDIEDGINEFAELNNLDLIIAIPKKHKLLEGFFKPSSTRQLVLESHVPVMCVHE